MLALQAHSNTETPDPDKVIIDIVIHDYNHLRNRTDQASGLSSLTSLTSRVKDFGSGFNLQSTLTHSKPTLLSVASEAQKSEPKNSAYAEKRGKAIRRTSLAVSNQGLPEIEMQSMALPGPYKTFPFKVPCP